MSDPTQSELSAITAKLGAILSDPKVRAALDRIADENAAWRFGSSRHDRIAKIAVELEGVRLIDQNKLDAAPGSPNAEIRKLQKADLSQWLSRVKRAVDEGDADFFDDIAQALRLIEAKPSAARDHAYFALGVLRDFRRAGIEPTRADIREEVERILFGIADRTSGDPAWKRIWKHRELAGLRQRRRGEEPQRLPEE